MPVEDNFFYIKKEAALVTFSLQMLLRMPEQQYDLTSTVKVIYRILIVAAMMIINVNAYKDTNANIMMKKQLQC